MRLAVIGSGYVGLVAAACLAREDHDVTVVDVDAARIDALRSGACPIYEPGLPALLDRGRAAGRLRFTTDATEAVADAGVVLLAVGTPSGRDGAVDLTQVEAAAHAVAAGLRAWTVIVLKSTVPVGTHERLADLIRQRAAAPFALVSNPEFLKEGAAIEDFLAPDRVIVGTEDADALAVMRRLYAPFLRHPDRLLVMDPRSAELTKYASNAMLAVRVGFMNELSRLCESVGADVDHLRRGMGADPRIGPDFLHASLGFGGSCLPKDVRALARLGDDAGAPQTVVRAAWDANLVQQEHFAGRVADALGGSLEGRVIAQWGLAFKAHTDDVRASAAIWVAQWLRRAGATLRLHDPAALDTGRAALGDTRVTYHRDPYEALDGAEALVIATEWPEYRHADLARMAHRMVRPLILDGRNLYPLARMADGPFTYHSVGRPSVGPGHRA